MPSNVLEWGRRRGVLTVLDLNLGFCLLQLIDTSFSCIEICDCSDFGYLLLKINRRFVSICSFQLHELRTQLTPFASFSLLDASQDITETGSFIGEFSFTLL
ncbi:hypothetical protein QQG55_41265 [Brugia pahangi]